MLLTKVFFGIAGLLEKWIIHSVIVSKENKIQKSQFPIVKKC